MPGSVHLTRLFLSPKTTIQTNRTRQLQRLHSETRLFGLLRFLRCDIFQTFALEAQRRNTAEHQQRIPRTKLHAAKTVTPRTRSPLAVLIAAAQKRKSHQLDR